LKSAAGGPGGTVSPAAYDAEVSGVGGVSAMATSPKIPIGLTTAFEPLGIEYWSSIRNITSR
jgi:hypothetical protein